MELESQNFTKDPEELKLLDKFCTKIADLNVEQETALRFLRARDGDIGKAELMLRQSCKWREDNLVDSFRFWTPPKILLDDFIIQYLGLDVDGYPVVYIPLGRWNVRDRIEDGFVKDVLCCRFYLFESVLMPAIDESKKSQFVVIVDMNELNFHKVAHMETMNMVIKTVQDFDANYPERLKLSIVINIPWAFSIGFNIVKPLIAPKTLAKIQIFDSNKSKWLPTIRKTIPKDILPHQLS